MKNILTFFDQVKQEIQKVTWPVRKEVVTTTIIVVIVVLVASVFFLAVDLGIHKIVQLILNL